MIQVQLNAAMQRFSLLDLVCNLEFIFGGFAFSVTSRE